MLCSKWDHLPSYLLQKSEMKRPTAYLVIDELAKRISGGSAEEKKKKYVALSPERLADALGGQGDGAEAGIA